MTKNKIDRNLTELLKGLFDFFFFFFFFVLLDTARKK